jgi:hypothetical protein
MRDYFKKRIPSPLISWAPLLSWASALALIGCFLYATYCDRAQIDIVTTSESLIFKISDADVNWAPIKISSLEIVTPSQIDGDIDNIDNLSRFDRITFEGLDHSLDLQSFKIAQNDTLSIRHLRGDDNLFEFSVTPSQANLTPTDLGLIISGRFTLDVADSKTRTLTSNYPRLVKASLHNRERVFRFRLAESELIQGEPFQVSAISFFDIIEQTRPALFSTIKGGSIRFEQIAASSPSGNKEKQLTPGEPIQMGKLENGYIRTIRLSTKGIYMGYFGDVLGLERVWRDNKIPLMPTRFDYWASDPAVVAYASLIATIVGLVAAGMALVRGT